MVDPYLAQRDMDLRVSQSLSEAERRGLARVTGTDNKFAFGNLMSAASAGFSRSKDQARNAANAIRTWYDDILLEMLQRENELAKRAAIQLEVERRRHIHTYVGQSFSVKRLHSATALLRDAMEFEPNVIIGPGVAIEDGVTIGGFCHIEQANIGEGATIGPFASDTKIRWLELS